MNLTIEPFCGRIQTVKVVNRKERKNMLRANVVCKSCRHKGGVVEYKAVDYDKAKVHGKPRKAEIKRSCKCCGASWFVKSASKSTSKKTEAAAVAA